MMAGSDEITEKELARFSESRQRDLIQAHCVDLEMRVAEAASVAEARQIANDACERFRENCSSSIVSRFLITYAETLLEKHGWNES